MDVPAAPAAPATGAEVLRRVDPPRAIVRSRNSWRETEWALGTRLPRDYRELIDDRGPGIAADVLVYGPTPGHPLDLLPWHRGIRRLFDSVRRATGNRYPPPLHPAPGGLMPWGLIDMQIVAWLTGPDDPDRWNVVELSAELDSFVRYDATTTEYLIDRLPGANARTLITG